MPSKLTILKVSPGHDVELLNLGSAVVPVLDQSSLDQSVESIGMDLSRGCLLLVTLGWVLNARLIWWGAESRLLLDCFAALVKCAGLLADLDPSHVGSDQDARKCPICLILPLFFELSIPFRTPFRGSDELSLLDSQIYWLTWKLCLEVLWSMHSVFIVLWWNHVFIDCLEVLIVSRPIIKRRLDKRFMNFSLACSVHTRRRPRHEILSQLLNIWCVGW